VSIRSPPDPARPSRQVEITGVRSGLLGRVASARGVELVATHGVLNDRFENSFETDTTALVFSEKMPADAAFRIGQKAFQRAEPLNFFAPGISMSLRGSTPYTTALCVFRADFLADMSNTESEFRLGEIDILTSIESERLAYLGRMMLHEAIQPGFASSIFAEAMGMAIVLEIARYDRALRSSEGKHSKLARWQMRRLESYVRDHLSGQLNLSELARLLGISVRHLSRTVKEAKGIGVHRWIAECRVAEARRLLAETELSVHEVAQRSAFQSAAAFSAAFRAASGFTPGEFRRLSLRGSDRPCRE
jgi:AraC-like DNA-binding protein